MTVQLVLTAAQVLDVLNQDGTIAALQADVSRLTQERDDARALVTQHAQTIAGKDALLATIKSREQADAAGAAQNVADISGQGG